MACDGHCLSCNIFWFGFVPIIYFLCMFIVGMYYASTDSKFAKNMSHAWKVISYIFAPITVAILILKLILYLFGLLVGWAFDCDRLK